MWSKVCFHDNSFILYDNFIDSIIIGYFISMQVAHDTVKRIEGPNLNSKTCFRLNRLRP